MDEIVRIVFMGTAPLAKESLRALLEDGGAGLNVVGVVSQPDRPAGRKLKLMPTPVKELAVDHGLEVFQPEKIRSFESREQIAAWKPDLAVVAAYGQILPKSILAIPRLGCLNVHASILPYYRGAAPIQWAVYDRVPETGVTIMKMDEGMDTGDILSIARTPLDPHETSGELHDRLAVIGAKLLVETIPGYVNGDITPVPQDHDTATYARKIDKSDGLIDWSLNPEAIVAHINAWNPWPGSLTWLYKTSDPHFSPVPIKVWKVRPCKPEIKPSGKAGEIVEAGKHSVIVECGSGKFLELVEVQVPGRKRVPVSAVQSAGLFEAGMTLAPEPLAS